jgi:hypothetical protein
LQFDKPSGIVEILSEIVIPSEARSNEVTKRAARDLQFLLRLGFRLRAARGDNSSGGEDVNGARLL